MFSGRLATIDLAIVGLYLVAMMVLGLALARSNRDQEDFFLAGRSMTWPLVGFSLLATNFSSSGLIGFAGDAYATGISVYNYEWMAALVLIVFALFILPSLLRSRVYTLPEFLELRYSRGIRLYLAALQLFLGVVLGAGSMLYAGSLVLTMVFAGVPVWALIAGLGAVTGIYAISGGLRAVMITDLVQGILLIGASLLIAIFAFDAAGGWQAVMAAAPPEKLSLVRPADDPGVPWTGLLTGLPLLGLYYWTTNQTVVQRALAARSIEQGQWGALFCAFLKLFPLFIMVLPGTAALVLYPDLPRADLVYPTLMFDLLPAGLLGLALAGFLAALMSSLDSSLSSSATLVTMDFVRLRWPQLSGRALLRIGRIASVLLLLFAILWAPQIARFDSLFKYIQMIMSYAAGPVVLLFLAGIFWPRANRAGAAAAVVTGLAAAAIIFVAREVTGSIDWHFLAVGPAVFVASAVAMVAASLATPPPDRATIAPLLFTAHPFCPQRPAWQDPRWQAVGIVAMLVVIVIAFR
jgi:SSS family solute:Na+ symporter